MAQENTYPPLSGLKIWRLTNKRTYYWVAAKTEREAIKYADRVCGDLLPWSVTYAGSQHDNKAQTRGILDHDKVMRLFKMAPVR